MTIALSNLVQTLLGLGLCATSMTSVLTVMSETDEARRSSDGVFIYKASQEEIKNTVPKQRRSLSAARTTSSLTASFKAKCLLRNVASSRRIDVDKCGFLQLCCCKKSNKTKKTLRSVAYNCAYITQDKCMPTVAAFFGTTLCLKNRSSTFQLQLH